jgi:glutamate N-acetyltransferase/amino-acid N-acetyltransferase
MMATVSSGLARSFARCAHGQIRHYSAPLENAIPAAKQKYVPTSGTYPRGFLVSGTHVGVKPSNTRFPDLAFIASEQPCSAAAVFTRNKFQAAPVQVSRAMLERRAGYDVRSIIINSGCANAVTGKGGLEDAAAMGEMASSCFADADDGKGSRSLVMSTGVIGQRLPIQKILDKIPTAYQNLDNSHEAWLTTARAICTTDTFPKLLSTTFTLPGRHHEGIEYRLAGMTKGAGMIHPNMATLLGIMCTDAPIAPSTLRALLSFANEHSFNCISIDGDTSTNDTVALLANGAAVSPRTPFITGNESDEFFAMRDVLTTFAQSLAQLVVRDGEGATKFVEVNVRSARSHRDARQVASTIARSPLVKTALYGKDANWGRILCAIGYTDNLSENCIEPRKTNVSFVPTEHSASKSEGPLRLLVNGEPEQVDEERAARLLQDEDLRIVVDLGTGNEEATYWFCDFSHEYVTINGDYRT